MTTLTEFVRAVGQRYRDVIPDLSVYDIPPGNPVCPAGIVIPPVIDYRQAMRVGVIRFDFEVVLLVSSAAIEHQYSLFEYLDWQGRGSVFRAVEIDPTLGLENVDCKAMGARPLGLEEVAAFNAYGAAVQHVAAITNPS
jgi:hypothetical protein